MAFNPYAASKKRGEKGGSLFTYLKTDAKFFKLEKIDNFAIDIIPYKIKTKNHPAVISGDAEIGDETYVLDVFTHGNIGPKKATVICPNKSFGKKCPICEAWEVAKNEHSYNSPEAKALQPKQRVVYNVVNVDDPDAGVQIFEVSYFKFEKELLEQAESDGPDHDVDFVPFGSSDPGFTVKFRTSEGTYNSKPFYEAKNFQFKKRKPGAVDKWLDKAYALDELMMLRSYDDLTVLLNGADDDEEEETVEEAPRKRVKDEDEEEDTPPKSSKPDCYGDPKQHDDLDECEKCDLWSECRQAVKKARAK